MIDFSNASITFDDARYFWDGNFLTDLPGGISPDVYDNGNGSLSLAWSSFAQQPVDSYNVYLNGVLQFNTRLQTATLSGLVTASYVNGVLRPSQTYSIRIVAVFNSVEIAATETVQVTPGPTSIMLTTPMRRPFPFPNVGGF